MHVVHGLVGGCGVCSGVVVDVGVVAADPVGGRWRGGGVAGGDFVGRLIILFLVAGGAWMVGTVAVWHGARRRRDAEDVAALRVQHVECPLCGATAPVTSVLREVTAATKVVKVSCRCGYVGSRYVM